MDMTSRMTSHFRDAAATLEQSMNELAEPLAVAVDVLFGALANNGRILACGNGGSAADAQHFVAELVGRFERERLPLAGIALNTDTSIMTAVGNDYGFDEIYTSARSTRWASPATCWWPFPPAATTWCAPWKRPEMHVLALTGKGGGVMGNSLRPWTSIYACPVIARCASRSPHLAAARPL